MQGRLLTILETVDDPKIIKEIAQDWLDRAGAGAPNRTATRALAVVVSDEVMQRFFTRAQEAGLLPAVQDPGSREVINGSLEGVFVEVAAAVDPAEQGT
jgi:hypothetical protein